MAKNLTDLTERTATADTDLMHINSSGTDYKETKENFTANLCKKAAFNNTSDFRAQCKTIAANGSERMYYGILGSYNHQTECGTPSNHNYYVMLQVNSSTAAKVELTIIGASGRKFESYMNQGTWSDWTELPSSIRGGLATIAYGNSKSFTVANSSRILLLDIGASAVRSGMWMIYVGGTGTPTIVPVGDIGNLVSISGSTNTITIQNTASSTGDFTIHAIVFAGSIAAN